MEGIIIQRRRPGGQKRRAPARLLLRRKAMLLFFALLPVMVGAWQDVSGNTINPRYVERIKDGQTTKHEVLLYFGDPQEVERTPEGPVYKYATYKDAPPMGYKPKDEVKDSLFSSNPFIMDEDRKIKPVPKKKGNQILHSTLSIRFKSDGETVLSHEYREY